LSIFTFAIFIGPFVTTHGACCGLVWRFLDSKDFALSLAKPTLRLLLGHKIKSSKRSPLRHEGNDHVAVLKAESESKNIDVFKTGTTATIDAFAIYVDISNELSLPISTVMLRHVCCLSNLEIFFLSGKSESCILDISSR
jgi:hypothetical protein